MANVIRSGDKFCDANDGTDERQREKKRSLSRDFSYDERIHHCADEIVWIDLQRDNKTSLQQKLHPQWNITCVPHAFYHCANSIFFLVMAWSSSLKSKVYMTIPNPPYSFRKPWYTASLIGWLYCSIENSFACLMRADVIECLLIRCILGVFSYVCVCMCHIRRLEPNNFPPFSRNMSNVVYPRIINIDFSVEHIWLSFASLNEECHKNKRLAKILPIFAWKMCHKMCFFFVCASIQHSRHDKNRLTCENLRLQ